MAKSSKKTKFSTSGSGTKYGSGTLDTEGSSALAGLQGTTGQTPTDWDGTVNSLLTQINGSKLTPQQLLEQAQTIYSAQYGAQKLAAEQAAANNILAMQQQAASLGRNYDEQRQASQQQYAQARSQADRAAMQRGMGRSSYNMQTLSNIDLAGAEAQQKLNTRQGEDLANINANITQTQQQLGQTLQQLAAGQASDQTAWVNNMINQQNQQGIQNTQWLANFLAQQQQNATQNAQWQQQFGAQQQQNEIQNQQWQQQFNAQYGGKKNGSSGPTKPTTNNNGNGNGNGTGGQSIWDKIMAGLGQMANPLKK